MIFTWTLKQFSQTAIVAFFIEIISDEKSMTYQGYIIRSTNKIIQVHLFYSLRNKEVNFVKVCLKNKNKPIEWMNRVNFQKEIYLIYYIKYGFLLFLFSLSLIKVFGTFMQIAESKRKAAIINIVICLILLFRQNFHRLVG